MTSYLQAGGSPRFLTPLLDYWKMTPLANMTQAGIDACAVTLYPKASPATRNRQVYSPMLAVFNHAGHVASIKRPKGGNGSRRTCFLQDEQLFRVLDAADELSPALGALMELLAYCGPRLSEALSILCDDVDLSKRTAFIRDSKNGEPQLLHLPANVVVALANLPLGLDRPGERVFRQWTKGGYLYQLVAKAYAAAGVDPQGAPFHIHRHTYGTNMKRLGVLPVDTGRWKDPKAGAGYVHIDGEARKADLIPIRRVK